MAGWPATAGPARRWWYNPEMASWLAKARPARRWRNVDERQNNDWKTCRGRARGAFGRLGDGSAGVGAERAVHPQPGVPDRRLRTEWRSVRQWHRRLLHPHQRTRRWHLWREDRVRGMRH